MTVKSLVEDSSTAQDQAVQGASQSAPSEGVIVFEKPVEAVGGDAPDACAEGQDLRQDGAVSDVERSAEMALEPR